jgi:hypothetical protein
VTADDDTVTADVDTVTADDDTVTGDDDTVTDETSEFDDTTRDPTWRPGQMIQSRTPDGNEQDTPRDSPR